MNTYHATFLFFFCSIIITITILNNLTIIILSLFTLGSILYSTYASGVEQMTETNNSNETINGVKNPHWPEANQLAIYKPGKGFELGMTVTKSS